MKKFLSLFLTALLLLAPMTIFAVGATSNKDINEEKITDELKEVMSDKKNNEYIPIYIWLYDLGDEVVYSRLSNKLGKSLNQDNEGLYIEENVKNKVDKFNKKQKEKKNNNQKFDASVFREEAEIGETLTNEEIENCIDAGKTTEQIIELSERYQYLSDFRNSRVEINASVNEIFEKNINRAKCKNVNIDMLLPYVTMECKKNYISKLSTMNVVKEIGFIQESNNNVENQESSTLETTETEETTTDKYIMQPIDTPYTGAGIRVGVIEAVPYYSNATHLQGMNITNYTSGVSDYFNHATRVLSVLCGQKKMSNGLEYQGIAPQSDIFFVNAINGIHVDFREFYWLIVEKDVAVINMSFKFQGNESYDSREQKIDCLVAQYRVTVVVSAGNETNIVTPSKAYNIISVGNMSNQTDANGKYLINASCSSFEEASYLTNKPDICAFGTNIYMLYGGAETNLGEGTSIAAPQVTGTIALMMEANPALIGQPHKVKAILLTSANDENVSETDGNADDDTDNSLRCTTPTYNTSYFEHVAPITRNKTGAGILNTKAAIESALHPVTYSFQFTSNGSKRTNEIFIPSNMNIKAGLVYEKSDHDLIDENNPNTTNINVEMIDINTGNVVFSSVDSNNNSSSRYDNVKVFDVKTKVTGTYVFRIICSGIDISDEGTTAPEIHQNSHEAINVALSFACSCLNPLRGANTQAYSDESNAKVNYCNAVGCFHTMLTDITYYDELSWNEGFGEIDYTVTHKRSYSNEIIITDVEVDYSIYLNDSYQTCYVRYTHGNIETVPYGYIDRYYFEIYAYDSLGNMTPYETAIEVEHVNTFDRVYVYPIMVN